MMKKGRTTLVTADDASERNDVVVPLLFGVVRPLIGVGFCACVMLAAWGCSKTGSSPAPSDHTKEAPDRNDAVVPPRSELHSERSSEPAVSRKVGEVSEGSEKGSEVGCEVKSSRTTQLIAPAAVTAERRVGLIQLLSDGDLRAAFEAADREAPGPMREEMFGRFSLRLAKSMPAEAAAIVEKDMAAGAERDEAAIAVIHQWALNDLVGAQAWAKTFTEGPLKTRAMKEIAGVTDYVEATLRQRTDG